MRTSRHYRFQICPLVCRLSAIPALLTLAGCSASFSVGPTVGRAATTPQAPAEDAPQPGAAPRAYDAQPGRDAGAPARFENRARANLVRHTFSESGADFDPDLAPDGTRVYFASTRQSARPDIFVKPLDGYTLTQLTNDPASDVQPRISPDGRRLAFASDRSGNWDIWVVELETNQLTQLTDDAADEIAPSWSPDGKLIACSRWGKRSNQWELWELSPEKPGPTRFLAHGVFADWSRDGRQLVFQRPRERGARWYSIWLIDRSEDSVGYPTEIASSETAACVAPRMSPDGRWVAFATVMESYDLQTSAPRAAVASDVWLVETASGRRRPLTGGLAPAHNPAWAKDGRIFFVSSLAGSENIWSTPMPIMDDSGSAPQVDFSNGAIPPRGAEPIPGDP